MKEMERESEFINMLQNFEISKEKRKKDILDFENSRFFIKVLL